MLTRIRIEVVEETAEACVEALWKYEHAIVQQEVRRYRHRWPVELQARTGSPQEAPEPISFDDQYPTPDQPWSDGTVERDFYNEQLGRELKEERIAYEEGEGFVGRRVVSFTRLDTRSGSFLELEVIAPVVGWHFSPGSAASSGVDAIREDV